MKKLLFLLVTVISFHCALADDALRRHSSPPHLVPLIPSSDSGPAFHVVGLGGAAFTEDAGVSFSDGTTGVLHFNPAPTAGARLDADAYRSDCFDLALAPEFLWTPLRFDVREIPSSEQVTVDPCTGKHVAHIPGFEASGNMDRYDTSLNLLAKFKSGKFQIYAGPGALFSIVDVHDLSVSGAQLTGSGDTDMTFGAQCTGGIRYIVSPHWSLGLEGKYTWAPDLEFNLGASSAITTLKAVDALFAATYSF